MKSILVFLSIVICSCTTTPPVATPTWVGEYKNACLPEAIVMAQGLRNAGIQSRVVRIRTNKWNHAICTYLYPSGSNTLWGWDSYWKSNRIRAFSDNPDSIARSWMYVTLSDAVFVGAEFLDSNSNK